MAETGASTGKIRRAGAAGIGLAAFLVVAGVAASVSPRGGGEVAAGRGTPPAPATLGDASGQRQPTTRGEGDAVSDRLIIKFREPVTPQARAAFHREQGLERLRELGLIGADVVRVAGRPLEAVMAELRARPEVAYVEPDHLRFPSATYSAEPLFGSCWGLNNSGQSIGGYRGSSDVDVNALEAASVTLGDPNLVVAVIDDGVDFSHPDLADRQWMNPGESGSGRETNGVDDDGNGFVDDVNGWDFFHGDRTVHDRDEDYHGTHVAGTIAASLNGVGVVGVAPNVRIMALKFLGPNGGYTSDAIKAIEYARRQGVRIANNSWGGSGYNQALKDAIDASGMLFVAAAGNSALNNDTDPGRSYPASYDSPNILSVAAYANDGSFASWFSNYGPTSVDIVAPGVDVLSTMPATSTAAAGWGWMTGTSMATPHATGVAALAASVQPALRTDPAALRQLILDRGKPAPDSVGRTLTGRMVDARAVLGDAAPPAADSTAPTGTVTLSGGAARTNTYAVSAAVPATDNTGGSGVASVRISNNGSTWATYGYTTPISWSLSDAAHGGSTTNGTRTVYAQWSDGAGNWSPVSSDTIVLDTVKPGVTAPIQAFATNSAMGSTVPVRVSWSGSDATSGIARYELQQSTNGGAWTGVTLSTATATSIVRSLSYGSTYRFQVRVVDGAGNASAWLAGPTFSVKGYSETSTSIAYGGTWKRTAVSTAQSGYLTTATAPGASARFSFSGRAVAWVAPRGSTMGEASVYVDGAHVANVNLYASSASARILVFTRTWATAGQHTLEVRVVGTSGHPNVSVDGFLVIP